MVVILNVELYLSRELISLFTGDDIAIYFPNLHIHKLYPLSTSQRKVEELRRRARGREQLSVGERKRKRDYVVYVLYQSF